jgi:tetrachlorobenzoquinone reductase
VEDQQQHLTALRVHSARADADSVRILDLRAADGSALPAFTAGAHVEIRLPDGRSRQYSLINPPCDHDRYVIAVARHGAGRGGSQYLHDSLRIGDILFASPPGNHFALEEQAEYSVLLAGGIGITPIWSLAQRLIALGRAWELHYAARTRSAAALLTLLESAPQGAARLYLTREGPDACRPNIRSLIATRSDLAHFYCCGPPEMVDEFTRACVTLPGYRIHLERFSAAPGINSAEDSFEVQLARSGRTLQVGPGQSILSAVQASGLNVAYSCREGVCGKCEVRVLEGTPDHRDALLTATERRSNTVMMICCSRALTPRLVLDL